MSFNNQLVLVTGGTRGIGAAIATHLEAKGARLLLTGTDPAQVDALNKSSSSAREYVQADFSDEVSTEKFLQRIESEPLDVCVNNAGINILAPMQEASVEDLEKMTRVDYLAPYRVAQAAARAMISSQRSGRIVNVASIWSVVTKAERSMYSAAKTGVLGMTRGFAVDLAPHGILVNAISPGFILTDLTSQNLSKEEQSALAKQVPLGRLGEPEEIARAVAFLASPENTYLTGQNLIVDGGFTHV